MKKGLAFRVGAACLGLVVAFLVLELVARFAMPTSEGPSPQADPFYRASKNLKLQYEQVPNAHGERLGRPWRTNSAGFRDREFQIPKPSGVFRILVLGDSVMLGGDMPVEQIAAKRLEALLNEASDGPRYEVINMAVAGYDTSQEVELLKVRGMEYEPDLALFGYCLNDPDIARGEMEFLTTHPGLDGLHPQPGSLTAQAAKYLYCVRAAYRFSRRYRAATRARERMDAAIEAVRDPYPGRTDFNEELLKEVREHAAAMGIPSEKYREHYQEYFASLHINQRTWQRVAGALDELQTFAGDESTPGIRTAVVILPVCVEFEPYFLRPVHDFLKREFNRHDIAAIDMLERFRGEDPRKLALSDKDRVHYSSDGHDALARALFAELRERSLVSEKWERTGESKAERERE